MSHIVFETVGKRVELVMPMTLISKGIRPAPTTIFFPAEWEAIYIKMSKRAPTKLLGKLDSAFAIARTVLQNRDMRGPWFTPAFTAARNSWMFEWHLASASNSPRIPVCTLTETLRAQQCDSLNLRHMKTMTTVPASRDVYEHRLQWTAVWKQRYSLLFAIRIHFAGRTNATVICTCHCQALDGSHLLRNQVWSAASRIYETKAMTKDGINFRWSVKSRRYSHLVCAWPCSVGLLDVSTTCVSIRVYA